MSGSYGKNPPRAVSGWSGYDQWLKPTISESRQEWWLPFPSLWSHLKPMPPSLSSPWVLGWPRTAQRETPRHRSKFLESHKQQVELLRHSRGSAAWWSKTPPYEESTLWIYSTSVKGSLFQSCVCFSKKVYRAELNSFLFQTFSSQGFESFFIKLTLITLLRVIPTMTCWVEVVRWGLSLRIWWEEWRIWEHWFQVSLA